MKANELRAALDAVIADGRGEHEVAVMVVEDGVTFAQPVQMCTPGDPADGDMVWLHVGELLAPEWMK